LAAVRNEEMRGNHIGKIEKVEGSLTGGVRKCDRDLTRNRKSSFEHWKCIYINFNPNETFIHLEVHQAYKFLNELTTPKTFPSLT